MADDRFASSVAGGSEHPYRAGGFVQGSGTPALPPSSA